MRLTFVRPLGVIAFGVAPAVLLAGCGDDATGARSTLAEIQPSSYVVREPATTTTTLPAGSVNADGTSPVEQVYTIQAGDYPGRVAELFGITVDELNNYNDDVEGYSAFYVGLEIKIPPGANIPAATGSTDTATETDTDTDTDTATDAGTTTTLAPSSECTEGTYTIAEGDIPITVAEQFDVTVDELNAANASTPGYGGFIVGIEIVIPC